MKKNDLIKLSIVSALIIAAYIPTFIWMLNKWTEHDTYYSHAFLVPFISIFIVWLKRKEFADVETKPSSLGWLFFFLGIFIHLLSLPLRISFTSALSLILVLIGMILIFFGKQLFKKNIFPVFFLLFMIPLPAVVIANLSFRLKIFAASIATFLINRLGVPAVRDGSIIKTMHSYIMVEDPCSGIRSLIALISLGALMAYFSNISNAKKMFLFGCSIPIAIGSNIIRITSTSLVSEIYGTKYASGFFHDAMGILVFVFAFLGLAIIAKMLE